jgi:hypothetical protein
VADHNGFLQYKANGVTNQFSFYIERMSQPFTLSGASAQTRLRKQFFPRGYSPGNLSITGRVTSQDALQGLAKFIRDHHVTLVNTPGSMAFTRLDSKTPGYNRLMFLYVVGEGISYRGWIPRFTINKKGVFEPAPQFTLDFFSVFDQHATNIYTSKRIQKLWWDQAGSPQINHDGGGATFKKVPVIQQDNTTSTILPGDSGKVAQENSIPVPGSSITIPR